MKQFACGDVVPDCAETFTADTEEEILALVAEHARAGHGVTELPASLVAQVRERIADIPAG